MIPPIHGLEDVPAFSLYRRDDIEALKPLCVKGARALIIGIGLIGLQAIMALKSLGVDVAAVELVDKVLPLILDKQGAKYAKHRLEANGVEVYTGAAVEELSRVAGEECPCIAITMDGVAIGFDFIILSTGMKPETSLLDGLGVQAGRGIRVSSAMETSIPGVYAAGDVVEYLNWIEGDHEVHAHWVNAYRQGRVAGLSMAGMSAEPYTPIYLNSMDILGLPVITMGASRIDAP